MKTKKIFVSAAAFSVLILTAVSLLAWGPDRGGYHHGDGYHHGYGQGNIEHQKKNLNLSDKQVEKIIKIDSEYRTKYYKNRENFDKIEQLRIEHRKEFQSVLTDTQRKKQNNYSRNNSRRGGRGSGCPYR